MTWPFLAVVLPPDPAFDRPRAAAPDGQPAVVQAALGSGATWRLPAHLQDQLQQAQRAMAEGSVRGRFAPSPTGPLHLGNLRTALLSWLDARLAGGEWLLRIDDLDTPRNRPGAEDQILEDLRWLGLSWDGPILRQSHRRGLYASVLSSLRRAGFLYPCRCSRRMLAAISAPHGHSPVYPGTCRNQPLGWGPLQGQLPSWRLRLEPGPLRWLERGLGWQQRDGAAEVGDVVLRRADGFLAYHLATAVDELWLGITTVVRGRDLLEATAAQVAVMAALGAAPPSYLHVPLWCSGKGERLAKRHGDQGLGPWRRRGEDAAAVVGYLAASLALVPSGARLSAHELLQDLAPQGLAAALRAAGPSGAR